MLTIYTKPTCSTCRSAMKLVNEYCTEPVEAIEYLVDVPTQKTLKDLIRKLGIKAEDLVRKKESLYKEKYKGKKLSEGEWVKILAKHPVLIERPVLVMGNKAIIGRPVEKIVGFLKENSKAKRTKK